MDSYGVLPLNQSQAGERRKYTPITSLTTAFAEQTVLLRARVTTSRPQGKKVFFNLRQRDDSIQGLLILEQGKVSSQMLKWAGSLADESIVRVEGVVQTTPQPVKSATVSDVEIMITKAR